jgi:protein-tyrosine kinase
MSRIDEALRQAGLKSNEETPNAQPGALEMFPEGAEAQNAGEIGRVAPAAHVPPRHELPPTANDRKFPVAEKLVIHDATGRGCVEQYRRIAAMLHQWQEERGLKVVMVASAQVGEGKTLTTANLALTLSESYKRRVLLIDADLRRPSLSALFRIQRVSGLSESLQNATGGPLRVLELSERLSLLPGGKPNPDPMAGLTSGRMQLILDQAAANYDWVLLDTPPVSLQPDAQVLSTMVEATVFVIGAGISQWPVIQRAIDTIGRDRIVGIILNRVDAATFNESAYYAYDLDRPPIDRRNGQRSRAGSVILQNVP